MGGAKLRSLRCRGAPVSDDATWNEKQGRQGVPLGAVRREGCCTKRSGLVFLMSATSSGRTSVRVGVAERLDRLFCLAQELRNRSRVTDVPVALKGDADLDRSVPPQVAADVPVLRMSIKVHIRSRDDGHAYQSSEDLSARRYKSCNRREPVGPPYPRRSLSHLDVALVRLRLREYNQPLRWLQHTKKRLTKGLTADMVCPCRRRRRSLHAPPTQRALR